MQLSTIWVRESCFTNLLYNGANKQVYEGDPEDISGLSKKSIKLTEDLKNVSFANSNLVNARKQRVRCNVHFSEWGSRYLDHLSFGPETRFVQYSPVSYE